MYNIDLIRTDNDFPDMDPHDVHTELLLATEAPITVPTRANFALSFAHVKNKKPQ